MSRRRPPGGGPVAGPARLRGRAGRRRRRGDPSGDRGAPGGRAATPRAGGAPRGDRAGAAGAGGRPRGGRRMDRPGPAPHPVEDWNAEISLLTGTTAARLMLDAGIGVLRTLPAAEPGAVTSLRAVAHGLGIDWPAARRPAELLSALSRDTPAALALRRAATSLLRGAGYTAFDTAAGARRPPMRDTPGSAGRTRTSRRRCGGSSTGSARRCAWPWPPGRPCPTGCARPCPACPRRWRQPTPWPMRSPGHASTGPRRRCSWTASGRSFDAVVLGRRPTTAAGEVYLLEPPVIARCTGVRRPGETAGCGWWRPTRSRGASPSPLPGDDPVRQG